jgi:hypothetical protein
MKAEAEKFLAWRAKQMTTRHSNPHIAEPVGEKEALYTPVVWDVISTEARQANNEYARGLRFDGALRAREERIARDAVKREMHIKSVYRFSPCKPGAKP